MTDRYILSKRLLTPDLCAIVVLGCTLVNYMYHAIEIKSKFYDLYVNKIVKQLFFIFVCNSLLSIFIYFTCFLSLSPIALEKINKKGTYNINVFLNSRQAF